jgi:hypothetical protein
MDLGPSQPVRECPTCGVDAARAMVVAACVAWYRPWFECPRCHVSYSTLQAAADHLAEHEPDLVGYVRDWIMANGADYELVRIEE